MVSLIFLAAMPLQIVSIQRNADRVVADNGQIKLTLNTRVGTWEVAWKNSSSIRALYAEAKLGDGILRKSTDFQSHDVNRADIQTVKDQFGTGLKITWHHKSKAQPELQQVFWVYANKPEAFVQLNLVATKSIRSNYLAPIVTTKPIWIPHKGALQSLFVPYDNDMYFRYRSDGWGEGEGDGDGSYGVGALYNDETRQGIVVGALDHDTWKTAIRFKRNAGLRAFAGVTSKYTHDTQPHGFISGKELNSPRMVIGSYADWRDGLERFGEISALVKPPLVWKGAVPFGWNSWAGHKTKVQAPDAQAATDFIHDDVPQLRNEGIAYINFDSFWDNLTEKQLIEFVSRVHSKGLKAGIYFSPFTGWAELKNKVDKGSYKYSDIALKDAKGNPLPKLDGGWPLDTTHPGTIERNHRKMDQFVKWGFDFVKLDFLSHGSLEGQHFDPKITTGSQAYAYGMKQIVESLSLKKAGRPIFISLSIAPMFPTGYAHSRRISCDVFANIGATEYLLNSATYGWWTNRRVYQFNDSDATCLYQPKDEPPVTEEEAISRLTATVVSGGMLLSGDDLTKPEAKTRVKKLFANSEIISLARRGLSFRPVNGDSATKAGDMFVFTESNGKTVYLAVFNYEKKSAAKKVSFSRMGIAGKWNVHDIWTKKQSEASGSLALDLQPMQCALLKLTRI